MAEAIAQRKRTPLAIPDDVKAGADLYRAARKRSDGKSMDFQYALMDLARTGLKAVAAGFDGAAPAVGERSVAVGMARGGDDITRVREDLATQEKLLVLLVGALGEDAAIDMTFGQRMVTKARTAARAREGRDGSDGPT